jgi:hypothetical protein
MLGWPGPQYSYFYTSCIAGMTGMCKYTQICIDWDAVSWTFWAGWPWTMILPILAFQMSRITGISHCTQLSKSILYYEYTYKKWGLVIFILTHPMKCTNLRQILYIPPISFRVNSFSQETVWEKIGSWKSVDSLPLSRVKGHLKMSSPQSPNLFPAAFQCVINVWSKSLSLVLFYFFVCFWISCTEDWVDFSLEFSVNYC